MQRFIPYIIIAVLLVVVGYQQLRLIEQGIRTSFAREQIDIILESLRESQRASRPEGVSEHIENIRSYYPSGTKQVTGSTLDKIVEAVRQHGFELLQQRHEHLSTMPMD